MKNKNTRRDALVYHAKPNPGKIEVVPTTSYNTQRDLSLAYSPGVAFPCIEIEKDVKNIYKYTSKGNLVAVITNGTAVLGLGDIGPEASKPVMEGKALLFKIFAGIDVFDIEIDAKDPEKFIETVKNISPTFGGINLEDIKAPEAFEIERRLSEELNIPVMHDDQHGTAIISSAALINALDITKKKIEDVKMVVCGAGAAAISCTRMYKAFGLNPKNIIMTDSKGVIRSDREDLSSEKKEFATSKNINTLEEAINGSDVFIGLSKANMLTPKMLLSMAKDPIVFAMANPDPEIDYSLAMNTRDDIIMATGRSDYPNQVNNVLGFPFIFRGALDVRATKINDEMKMAAVKALASLAKEPVPEFVNIAYDKTKLIFGRNYIIPKPFDPRLITKIPPEVAKAAIKSGVALEPIECWEKYEEELHNRLGSDKKIIRLLMNRAKESPRKIIYVEADHLDVLKAAQIVLEEGIGLPILLGNRKVIKELKKEIEFDEDVLIIDPKSKEELSNREKYGKKYWEIRKRKGVTLFTAVNKMKERNLYAAMMLQNGDADALISGYSRSYPVTVKPMFEVIKKASGVNRVATTNLMITSKGPLFLSDTSINIDPSAKDLAIIAKMTSETVKMFGLEPNVAMVSYSNFGSSNHPMALKVNEAVKYLHRNFPALVVDGPVQSDFALNKEMFKNNFSFSKLSGKNVNTLIFPNLDSANTNYKLIKELDNALSIGPIMMGMSKAVHIIQLGASVEEMVNMSAVAVVDAQKKLKK
ncbi:MAG: NADP-dependent malic enzyme [Bacteroidetes bacterium]|jgi:malate dehydrogenase (oxaloacetate-decarboxylating)(NADP+)|nr:MAG: malic enzyme [Cryomorphaceae bacterium BACL29 MAG-121220-bin8]MDA0757680.1 NADP-dependent malic enzyme [Bacteroidota bacterium]MDA1018824.1 NADP-dependent malic enzyme [Bacteroidota bacterium]|tara:strand:+ start:7067 stop:9340 length:2274 start_codon:yes stop_codon:yes gene_type:complete